MAPPSLVATPAPQSSAAPRPSISLARPRLWLDRAGLPARLRAPFGRRLPSSQTPLLSPARRRAPPSRSHALAFGSIAQGFPLASGRPLGAALPRRPPPRPAQRCTLTSPVDGGDDP